MEAPSEPDEFGDAIRGEVSRCGARAIELVMRLESVSIQAFAVTSDILADESDASLLQHSHGIRGIVAQAFAVLEELQCVAGGLDALAAMRRTESAIARQP